MLLLIGILFFFCFGNGFKGQILSSEDTFYEFESTCKEQPNSVISAVCVNRTWFLSEVCNWGDCSYVTGIESWKSKCNLADFYNSFTRYQNISRAETYWYPAERTVDYGPYEFAIWGPFYGTRIKENEVIWIETLENIFEKNCLIQYSDSGKIIPEYCHTSHLHNCSFTEKEIFEFCHANCVSCSEIYTCVGAIKDKHYTVIDDGGASYYTNLNQRVNLEFENTVKTWSKQYEPLDCSVCLKNHCSNNVRMELIFNADRHSRKLYLAINSPDCLFGKGDPLYIYCFTDSGEELKKRVNLRKVKQGILTSKFMVFDVKLEKYIGSYWCKAFAPLTSSNPNQYSSNRVIAYKEKTGYEFAVRVKINNICKLTNCNLTVDVSAPYENFLIDDLVKPIEKDDFGVVRIMQIIEFLNNISSNNSLVDMIIHISTLSSQADFSYDHEFVLNILENLPTVIDVIWVKSCDFCIEEKAQNLTWPSARQYDNVLPFELCVMNDGTPVTRLCKGDFLLGLEWAPINGICSDTFNFHENTKKLQTLAYSDVSKDVVETVTQILDSSEIGVIDLYFVAQILLRIAKQDLNYNTVVNGSLDIINSLMKNTNSSLLTQAQRSLNITDEFLRAAESTALRFNYSLFEKVTIHKDFVILHSFNPILENASGFVLYNNFSIKNLPLHSNFNDIEDIEYVKWAVHISEPDIQNIKTNFLNNVSFVAIIYLNDYLFPSESNMTSDVVINLNIYNYDGYLQNPVAVLVQSELNLNAKFNCGFWDYGNVYEEKKGNWSFFGSDYSGKLNNLSNFHVCSYYHLTHLALLVIDRINDEAIIGTNRDILSVVSGFGSMISILGIFGIFLTALLFSAWRCRVGTKILMHLSISILFESIFLYVSGGGLKVLSCSIAGVVLQYVVISKFAWMLIYAFCQYLRFVRVFGALPDNLVLKSIVFGWGFALIPVLSVEIFNPVTYTEDNFCYPNNLALYLGVYLPIVLVLTVNLFIFCKIMWEITKTKFDKFHSKTAKVQQVKLGVLLFSVLGMPSFLGLFSNLIKIAWLKLTFVYIYTIGASLQGFLMFLFYVVFNRETRDFWTRLIFKEKKTYVFSSSKKTQSVSSIT